jgi:hypothetical protein
MSKNDSLPEWERVLSSAAHLQRVLPDAVLVGGTAAAAHAAHRLSVDADHVLTDLKARFDQVLGELESVAGWETARITRPVQILGSLDGIETGIRQLIRQEPLETQQIDHLGQKITLPTEPEMLRIKGALILKRNATRDYLDFAALADRLGPQATARALERFDDLYPQRSGESALQQLQVQLAHPLPYDLEQTHLAEYKQLNPKWHDWSKVQETCARSATAVFDQVEQWKLDRERGKTRENDREVER